MTLSDEMTKAGTLAKAGGEVALAELLDSAVTGLIVNTLGGTDVFTFAAPAQTYNGGVTVNAETINVNTNVTTTANDQTYNGAVVLGADTGVELATRLRNLKADAEASRELGREAPLATDLAAPERIAESPPPAEPETPRPRADGDWLCMIDRLGLTLPPDEVIDKVIGHMV